MIVFFQTAFFKLHKLMQTLVHLSETSSCFSPIVYLLLSLYSFDFLLIDLWRYNTSKSTFHILCRFLERLSRAVVLPADSLVNLVACISHPLTLISILYLLKEWSGCKGDLGNLKQRVLHRCLWVRASCCAELASPAMVPEVWPGGWAMCQAGDNCG